MSGVRVGVCEECGTQRFPLQVWCAVCGSDRIEVAVGTKGTVEETTTVRHVPGHLGPPVHIGTVRLAGGARVIARLEALAEEGSAVELLTVDGAPVARPTAP